MAALKAVIEDGISVRDAADRYGVPRSTLGDRVSGRVLPGATSGPPTYLTREEEEELVTFLCRTAVIGHGRTRQEVIAIVERVLNSRGIARKVSYGWWASFATRHPKLALRIPATLSLARSNADENVLNNYFDELECTLQENDLADKPCQIFNIDETGMPLDPKPLKVVTWKGHKNPSQVSSGVKTQITVVGCVSAGGQCLPPMVIWDRKNLPPELAVGEIPGTIYGLSHKGWIDQELFDLWFTRHFLRYAPPVRPLLLLMDGHSSHYCPMTIKSAAREKVILFSLPPNTTHLTQPLDKAIFGPLKMFWREVSHHFVVDNPGSRVTKSNFSRLFSEAWIQALTPRNIVSGFRITGVYPADRSAIKLPSDEGPSLAEKTGVAYIPLYTPAKRRISGSTSCINFTEEEQEEFEECFEEGTGNREDSRYQLWINMYHPHSSLIADSPLPLSYQPAVKHSSIGNYLECPLLPKSSTTLAKSSSIRVLTSSENLKRLEQKEKEKQMKLQDKEERARKREQRKHEKAQQRLRQGKKPSTELQGYVHVFSESERVKFESRYENGYDITTDERYNEWLAIYHPSEASVSMAIGFDMEPRGTLHIMQAIANNIHKQQHAHKMTYL